jgi:hypothetical protein
LEALAETIPAWLAWPLSAGSTVCAIAGGALVMLAAAFGSIGAVIWAAVAFGVSGTLWYAADYAQLNRGSTDF